MEISIFRVLLFSIALLISILVILSGWFTYKVLYPKGISLNDCLQNEIQKGWLDSTAFSKLNREKFAIPSQYGYLLLGEFIQTEKSKKTIILSHGISSNRFGMIRYIPLFQELGFNIVIYDMRGHGESGGNNTTYGFFEKYDLKSLVDWLIQKDNTVSSIGTMGISLGAAVSLQHAAIDSRVSFTIAEASFSDLVDLLTFRLKNDFGLPSLPFLPLTRLFCKLLSAINLHQISPLKAATKIQSPTFLIHGENDTYIPPEMSVKIFNSLSIIQKGLYLATGAVHSSSLRTNPEEYKHQLINFLSSVGIL